MTRTTWAVTGIAAGLGLSHLLVGGDPLPGQSPLPRYEIEARIGESGEVLRGTARIHLHTGAVRDGTARLDLSYSGPPLTVTALRGPSGASLPHRGPDDAGVLRVELPDPTPGSVEVEYSVDLSRARTRSWGYLLLTDPLGTAWYPRLLQADGSRAPFSDYRVVLEHPASSAVMTTGGVGRAEEAGAGRVRARYEARRVEDFAVAVGEGFVVERHETPGLELFAFFDPDRAEAFGTIVERTAEAAAWYARTYGFFPVESMAVIQGHPRWGGGFPLARMFMVHLGTLDEEFLSFITAHELGHYYWGLHVLGDEERLDWLQLSLGIWSDQLYLARRSGRSLESQWRRTGHGDWVLDYMSAMAANREQRLGITGPEENALGFDYNSLIRHGKAATGVYLQSLLLGPERFLDLQRRILSDYAERPLPVEEFVGLLEEEGLDGVRAFFDAWERGDARIGAAVRAVERGEEGTRVILRRTGPVPYPIGVEVKMEGGTVSRHVLAADRRSDTLRVRGAVSQVRLDPDGVVPMWNSAHPEMRSLVVRAFARDRLDGVFLPLARRHLEEFPGDEEVRRLLERRLRELGREERGAARSGTRR